MSKKRSNNHRNEEPRHTLTDQQWETLKKVITYPKIGRPPENERRSISGILWILKTRALPKN
jgi:transposase